MWVDSISFICFVYFYFFDLFQFLPDFFNSTFYTRDVEMFINPYFLLHVFGTSQAFKELLRKNCNELRDLNIHSR